MTESSKVLVLAVGVKRSSVFWLLICCWGLAGYCTGFSVSCLGLQAQIGVYIGYHRDDDCQHYGSSKGLTGGCKDMSL